MGVACIVLFDYIRSNGTIVRDNTKEKQHEIKQILNNNTNMWFSINCKKEQKKTTSVARGNAYKKKVIKGQKITSILGPNILNTFH